MKMMYKLLQKTYKFEFINFQDIVSENFIAHIVYPLWKRILLGLTTKNNRRVIW